MIPQVVPAVDSAHNGQAITLNTVLSLILQARVEDDHMQNMASLEIQERLQARIHKDPCCEFLQ